MKLSAYERKGEAKLFFEDESIRQFIRPVKPTYSPSTGVRSPESETIVLQPRLEAPQRYPSARAVKFLVRKIGFRLIPIVGWGLLAKDIYDIVTD